MAGNIGSVRLRGERSVRWERISGISDWYYEVWKTGMKLCVTRVAVRRLYRDMELAVSIRNSMVCRGNEHAVGVRSLTGK